MCLSKITKEVEKKNLEAETLKSMTKTHEFENIKIEKKTSEQTLKIAKLEQQLESLKKKASLKLAKNMERFVFFSVFYFKFDSFFIFLFIDYNRKMWTIVC